MNFGRRSKSKKKVQDEIYKPVVEDEFIRSFLGSDVKKAQIITLSNILHSHANKRGVTKFSFFTKGESKKIRYWMTPKLFIISLNISNPPIEENHFILHKFYDDKYVSFHLNPAACSNMIYFMDKVTDVLSKLEFFKRIALLTDNSNLDPYLYQAITNSSIQNYSETLTLPIAIPSNPDKLEQLTSAANFETYYSPTSSSVYKLNKDDGQLDYSTTQRSHDQPRGNLEELSESSKSFFISPPSSDESQNNPVFKAASRMKDIYLQSDSQESSVSISSSFRSSRGHRSTSVRPRKRDNNTSENDKISRSSINNRSNRSQADEPLKSNNRSRKQNRNSVNAASTSSRTRRNHSVKQKRRNESNRNSINNSNAYTTENDEIPNIRSNRSNRNSLSSTGSRRSNSVWQKSSENFEYNTNEMSSEGKRSRRRRNGESVNNDGSNETYNSNSRRNRTNDDDDDNRYDMLYSSGRQSSNRNRRSENVMQNSNSRYSSRNSKNRNEEDQYDMYSASSNNHSPRYSGKVISPSSRRSSSISSPKALPRRNNYDDDINQTSPTISHTNSNRRRSKSISNTYDGSSTNKPTIGNSNSGMNTNSGRNSVNNNRSRVNVNYTLDNYDHNYKGSSLMSNSIKFVNSDNNPRRRQNDKNFKQVNDEEESSSTENFIFDISNDEMAAIKNRSKNNTNESSTFESRRKDQNPAEQLSVLQITSDGTSSVTKTAPDLKLNKSRKRINKKDNDESGSHNGRNAGKIITHQIIRKNNTSFHKVVTKTHIRKNLSLNLDDESSFDDPRNTYSSLTNSSRCLNENPERPINSDDTSSEEDFQENSQDNSQRNSRRNSQKNSFNDFDSIDEAIFPEDSDSRSSKKRRK